MTKLHNFSYICNILIKFYVILLHFDIFQAKYKQSLDSSKKENIIIFYCCLVKNNFLFSYTTCLLSAKIYIYVSAGGWRG